MFKVDRDDTYHGRALRKPVLINIGEYDVWASVSRRRTRRRPMGRSRRRLVVHSLGSVRRRRVVSGRNLERGSTRSL